MAKPIEIKVGSKLIWKDGAPGPAYGELQCNALKIAPPTEWLLRTYLGEKPPVPGPGPACEVFVGAPLLGYVLSLFHAGDDRRGLLIDLKRQGRDRWLLLLAVPHGDHLVVNVPPWAYDGEGGAVPGAPAKIVVGPDGSVKVFTRPVVWVGDEEVVTGPATLALSFSAAEISAALDVSLAGMYPAIFNPFGGVPVPTGFWTGFRKCHEA